MNLKNLKNIIINNIKKDYYKMNYKLYDDKIELVINKNRITILFYKSVVLVYNEVFNEHYNPSNNNLVKIDYDISKIIYNFLK